MTSEWAALSRSVRRLCWGVGGGSLVLVGWILVYVWTQNRLTTPRGEELWPALGGLGVAALAAAGLTWSRGEPPLLRALKTGRVNWVASCAIRGSRGSTLVSVRFGFTNGKVVHVMVDPPALSADARMALAKEVAAEAVSFFKPSFVGMAQEAGFRSTPAR